MKILYILPVVFLSILVAGGKGISLLWKRRSPNGTDWWKNTLGWSDKRMKPHWDRLLNDEPKSHTLTNLLVEWFEMDKESLRRGVKVLSGGLVVSWVLLLLILLIP